jgi:hypothetical protein
MKKRFCDDQPFQELLKVVQYHQSLKSTAEGNLTMPNCHVLKKTKAETSLK